MSEWEALVGSEFMRGGVRIAWRREFAGGMEYTNGSTVQRVTDPAVTVDIEPLVLHDEMARTLLAALLRHYNGADDARMLRKDYDAERARVDKLLDALVAVQR